MERTDKEIIEAMTFIKEQHNGELPYKFGTFECAKMMAKYLKHQFAIHDVSNAERTLAIKFADALLNDFEMSEFENQTLCWKLCGVSHKFTTIEAYDRYIDEILADDRLQCRPNTSSTLECFTKSEKFK